MWLVAPESSVQEVLEMAEIDGVAMRQYSDESDVDSES
jgi:hypothetical protein